MTTWEQFAAEAPELAALVLGRFESTGLVMLGTLRKDGWPRVTPIEFTIFDGDLVLGGMWRSKKMLDLLRDNRCAIHSTTTDKDGKQGDAKLYGRAQPVAGEREERYWQHIFALMNWRPDGPAHVFAIGIESAAFVRFDGAGSMSMLRWPGAQEWETRASPP